MLAARPEPRCGLFGGSALNHKEENAVEEKTGKDPLEQGLDRLEEVEVAEITDADLDSVAGGTEELVDDGCSVWCCSSSG